MPRQTIEKYGDRWLMAQAAAESAGRYELVYWRLNDKVRLKKNPLYWDAAHTRNRESLTSCRSARRARR